MTDPADFVAIERQKSVVALAIEQIRRLIESGALEPGQRLPSERALSDLFGVSRPSVREAIRALGFMGVLEIRQGSGTYVSTARPEVLAEALASVVSVSREALAELMQVRLWLEVGAAEVAATHVTDEQLARLAEIVADAESSLDDVQRFIDADIAFHRVIHEASGNAVVTSLMQTLGAMARQSRYVTGQQLAVRQSSVIEHKDVLKALEARDPIAARRAMRAHLQHVAPYLLEQPVADATEIPA